jgi:FAD synthetase
MKKVMVFGTFDGLHEGHLDFFRQAREYGDYLIVVAGRDKNVEKLKGNLPKKDEEQRVGDLIDCDLVDDALLGDETDPYKLIENLKPDVICLGYDQHNYADNLEKELKERGLENIEIDRLKPYKPEKFHSSILNK